MPPHTLQHNGAAERRHRHLVETGLTLLQIVYLPSSYTSSSILLSLSKAF